MNLYFYLYFYQYIFLSIWLRDISKQLFWIIFTFLYPKGKSKYELIKEITDWMKEYRKKNNVVIVNNEGKPFLFEE